MNEEPRSTAAVIAFYREQTGRHRQQFDRLNRRRSQLLLGLGLAAAAIVWLTLAAVHGNGSGWPIVGLLGLVVLLIVFSLRVQSRLTLEQRRLDWSERGLRRVDGTEPQSGRTGLEANQVESVPGHLYERDLNLTGVHSLFGMLATVRTGPGELGLRRLLLDPATHQEAVERQAAVRELAGNTALRERISLLGVSRFHRIPAEFFNQWLDDPPPAFAPAYRWVLGVTAVVAVGLLLVGLTHLRPWADMLPLLAADLAVQGALSLRLRARVRPVLDSGARLEDHVKLFSQGLAVLEQEQFRSARLRHLQQLARQPSGAVRALASLERQLAIIEQRPKEYFLLFSLLLAAGTQAGIAVARWKHRHASAMRNWLAAWSEFEALNALGGYAFEHPEDAWPELLPAGQGSVYEAAALAHPLLAGAIANDIRFDAQSRFYLISGSNMAGKSTLLRAIGINAVLAYAGAPVRAASLRLTPMSLGASLALTDSLAEGKSKFLAEVERLSAIVRASEHGPMLFLVDEIFSGTNSADRMAAASAVLHSMLRHGAVGALSTHDLALTELATAANGGSNVHMASPDQDDPLAFDYRLKAGANTSSSALALVRLLGLDA